jgi:SSS family transporter
MVVGWLWMLVGTVMAEEALNWKALPTLPDALGFAGPFAGVHGDRLIVAGGANFPDKLPWEGGTKVWYDRIFALDRPDGSWTEVGRLPRPLGYGVSISTPGGVICLGGSDAQQHYAEVFRLAWEGGGLKVTDLPPLPQPCANFCGGLLGNTIYVAGGIETPTATTAMHHFWSLDLSVEPLVWRELEAWPGPARMLAVAAVQDNAFYLVSGADLRADAEGKPQRIYLQDGYCYRPGQGWRAIADMPRAAVAAPTPAPQLGPSSFAVMGGDDGTLIDFQPTSAHPGFPKSILAYHAVIDRWTTIGEFPEAAQVTTTAVAWGDGWVIPSGEIRPGVRTPKVWSLEVWMRKPAFGGLNYLVLVGYLLVTVWIAWGCSKRQQSTDDFFRGGQRIPWWAAGLSIFATMLSSITFMAVPAAAYTVGWNLYLAISYVLITPLVVFVYLPFYRRLDVTSAYEYLERRFNLAARLAGSALFILYQCGRIAIVLYLPALALATVSDFHIRTCILGMGVLCVLYTMVGGMEAVIWTDVAQAVVLLGAALLSLIYLFGQIPDGLVGIIRTAAEGQHLLETVKWNWDLTIASGWVIVIGSLFHNLFPYTASQDVVQRYLTTVDERTAARGIWLNALVSIPAPALFFAIGTGLYVYYRHYPQRLAVSLQNDAIFPYYVMSELPLGLAGLIVAGIFAASQSTLSSSMNSVATAYVTDFHRRLRPGLSDRACLAVARWVTLIVGGLGVILALIMAGTDIRSIYTTFLEVLGLAGGTLSGLFVLGIFSRRAHGRGALVGAMVSVLIVGWVWLTSPLNAYAYAPLGLGTCVVVGWLASHLIISDGKELKGLTIYT